MNARRPGQHVDNVYSMCPEWFDYIDSETAFRLIREREIRIREERERERAANSFAAEIAAVFEDDPLAGLGLEL